MKHSGTMELETDRLILRRFRENDAQAMYQNWAADPEVTKYLMWPPHDNVKISEDILKDWVEQYAQADYYQWAITVKTNGPEPIGSIGVVHQNNRIAMAHIGYCIGKAWWHQAITAEALRAVIHYLFTVAGLNRIELKHDPRNPNSGRVMLKCGLKYEGTMRDGDWNNQGVCDASIYAILRKEYTTGKPLHQHN